MPSEDGVFASVLQALEDVGILSDIVVIGGWAQHLYRQFFKNPPDLSALRTLDIDILFKRPPGIRPQADLEAALVALGFEREYGAKNDTVNMLSMRPGDEYGRANNLAVDQQGAVYVAGFIGPSSRETIPVCWILPLGLTDVSGEAVDILVTK